MNYRKKELEGYVNDKQMKHISSYLEESNVCERIKGDERNNSENFENSENLESFDDVINEKNCLIEELKSCLKIMQGKFDEEVRRYSIEVFIILMFNPSS